jgi:hypothetical protein
MGNIVMFLGPKDPACIMGWGRVGWEKEGNYSQKTAINMKGFTHSSCKCSRQDPQRGFAPFRQDPDRSVVLFRQDRHWILVF